MRELAARWVQAIDAVRHLLRRLVAEIVAADAGAVVAEPDRAVGFHHHVVRPGQTRALERGGEHRDRAVVLGAGQRAAAQLAGHQPALPVARVAVGISRRVAQGGCGAGDLVPADERVVGDVGEQQVAPVAVPGRPFGEAKAGGDAFDGGEAQHQVPEARIEHDDVGIGIADRRRRFPARWDLAHLLSPPLCRRSGHRRSAI